MKVRCRRKRSSPISTMAKMAHFIFPSYFTIRISNSEIRSTNFGIRNSEFGIQNSEKFNCMEIKSEPFGPSYIRAFLFFLTKWYCFFSIFWTAALPMKAKKKSRMLFQFAQKNEQNGMNVTRTSVVESRYNAPPLCKVSPLWAHHVKSTPIQHWFNVMTFT